MNIKKKLSDEMSISKRASKASRVKIYALGVLPLNQFLRNQKHLSENHIGKTSCGVRVSGWLHLHLEIFRPLSICLHFTISSVDLFFNSLLFHSSRRKHRGKAHPKSGKDALLEESELFVCAFVSLRRLLSQVTTAYHQICPGE